ncbi:hypothetical protein CSB09_02025 [Candidatus Gracilibacteria bacterium]|nr:MAG: hypothetical protein CSB09_02025 [Candidatus Gracilibacteria bacterium]
MKIAKIILSNKEKLYLQKRNLTKSFLKAERHILSGNLQAVDFKIRQPKKDDIYYFRINKQFRALCRLIDGVLVVFEIDNHQ